MAFANEQLFSEQLPSVNELRFSRLEKDYFYVLLFSRMFFFIFVIALFLIVILFIPLDIPKKYYWITGIPLGLLLIVFLAITGMVFKIKSYAVRQRDIIYRSGLIFRHTTIVPFNRVQHVELKTGPIDRMFGLSKLKIYTAGGSQSDLTIPGLKLEDAQQLKELIITKTAADEEE